MKSHLRLVEARDMGAWDDGVKNYLTYLAAANASPATIRLRHHYLLRVSADLPDPWAVSEDDLLDFLARHEWAPETLRSARNALRSFYGWAFRTGRVDADPALHLPPVRVPPAIPRPTPETVLETALARCQTWEERVMVMLAAYAGLRRAEVAGLHTRDIVEGWLRVTGKGRRTRVVPIHPRLAAELDLAPPGYLFPGPDGEPRRPDYVGRRLARLLGDSWTAHSLRHRFATKAYESHRDLLAVQQLLGHSKPETTQRYIAMPADALSASVLAIS